jgi:hypothetical protein
MGKVVKAVVGVVATVVGVVTGQWWLVAAGVALTMTSVIGPPKPTTSAATEQRLSKKLEPETFRKIVFGETAAGADLRYWEVFGTDANRYVEVLAAATHKIQSFGTLYINEAVASYDHMSRFTYVEGVSGAGTARGGHGKWTTSSSMTGCAYYVLDYTYKQEWFPQGISSRYTQVVQGALLYDPRRDIRFGGTHNINDQSTWQYSPLDSNNVPIGRNNALQMLWYQIGWRVNGKLVAGKGVDLNDIDIDSFIQAANDCELMGWYSDCILSTGDNHDTNEGILEAASQGKILDTGGRFSYYVAVDDTANVAVALESGDIIGEGFDWQPRDSMSTFFNEVAGTFVDPAALYQPRPFPMVFNNDYYTADGKKERDTVALAAVQSAAQAQKLMRIKLNRSRFQGEFSATFNYKAMRAQNYSLVTLQIPELGWTTPRLFRIVSYGIAAMGGIDLTLREESASIYAAGTVTTLPAPSTGVGSDPFVQLATGTITTAAITEAGGAGSVIDGVKLSYSAFPPLTSRAELKYRKTGETDWTEVPVDKNGTETIVKPLQPATSYEFSMRLVSVYGIAGAPTVVSRTTGTGTVAPDVAPVVPGTVAGTPTISITSTIASDGTQTSRLFGSWTAPANALTYVVELDNGTIVQQFPVTENAIEDRIIATGPTYRYRVKALSRTGTLSADWSAWSANATAAGKTTKPTAIISGSAFATGNRQIRVNLKIPADSDYSHALLYRNTSGINPDDIPQSPIGEVFGEFYVDANATIGTAYHYYASSVDRTGNLANTTTYIGTATAIYEDDRTRLRVSVGGSGAARWLRVARVQSSVGRGAARVTLTADGGGFVPSAVVLDVATDWGTLGTVTILSSSVSAPFLQVRLTKGTNEAYLDVQIPANSTTDIGIEVTPLPNSGGTWAALYVDSPTAGAQAICSGNLHDGAGNRFIGVISGNGGTSTSTVSSTGGGVQVNGTVGLRGTGDARLAENFINQSRFATATSLSLADGDIAAPWSALDSRPAVTQGDSLTEDPAMADPSAWNTHPTDFAFVTISDGQVARTAFRGTGSTFINLRGAPVDASKTYMIEGWYRRTGSNNTAYGLVSLRDGSGAEINGDGSYWLYHPSSVVIPTSWTYYSRVFGAGTSKTIPANAKEMRVGALPNYNGAAGAIEIQGLRIVEVTRIGGNLYRADGSVANESDVITSLGTSASTNNAPWSVVSGTGRPSDNAGTIGHLRTMGVHTGIIGNKVFKVTGGTHGAFQGGAVGTAQNGSAYISGSILSAGLPHGWSTYFALDDDDTTFVDSVQNYYLGVFANGVGTGTLGLYADGVYSSVAGVPLNTNSRATIAYDGQKVMGIVDGVIYLSAPARPGQRLFPKVLDYYNSVDSAFPHGVIDVRYGAWTENTVSTVTLVPYNAETSVTGSTATKVGGSNGGWGAGVSSREKYAGAAYCSFRIGPHAQPYLMAGLVDSAFGGTYATLNYALFTEGLPASSGVHVYQNGSFVTTISGVGEWLISDVWSIVYDGVRVQYLRNGVVRHTSPAAAGQILGFGASQVYINNSLTDIQVGPANMVARLGQNTYDDSGGALVGRTNLITSLGTANLVLNQTAAATAPDFLVFNNRTDGGSVSVRSPAGGGYSPGSPVTGCLKIRLPQNWSNTMLRFEVDIYDYNVGESVTYLIGGYSYFSGPNPNDGQWINHTAQFIGPRNRAMRVRFGHDGSYPCVYIGETTTVWSYPAVRVKDVNLGYLNIAESLWSSGWSVTLATSVGTITQETSVPRAGDQVFGEGLLEAPPGSLLPGAGVIATRAAHRTDQGTAAFLNGEGPLARSLLTEDKVRGRYLGEYAGDAAAVTAGIQNGDTYVDTSLTPYGFKVQSGGVIKEVDTSGLFRGFSTQVDVDSTTMTDKVTLNLTNIQANSYMVVWMAMDVELTPSRTRKSGGTPGINPQGTWEIVEDATGGSNSKTLLSGTWEANRIGSGGGADNIESFIVDGIGEPNSDVSRSWRVRAGGSRTWKLRMKTNSGENLLSVGLNLLVQIQRNPA